MNTCPSFASAIAPALTRYLTLKRTLGRRAETIEYGLVRLDRFLASRGDQELSAESFAAWGASMEHLAAATRRSRMRIVYGFCLFRRRDQPTCYLPDPSQFPPPPPRPRPYIFSEEDIARLLLLTDSLKPNNSSPLFPQVARLAIVVLYTTGLRRGELVRLTLSDYDAASHTFLIRNSKFNKSRLTPLSGDAAAELERYLRDRCQSDWPCESTAPLLLNGQGTQAGYTGAGLGQMLRKLFCKTGIRTPAGRLPRVHDLRFTFAVHALHRWYRAGVDVQARLPVLSAYLGHVSIVTTQYYLVFFDAITQSAGERFEEYCSHFLSTSSPEGGQP